MSDTYWLNQLAKAVLDNRVWIGSHRLKVEPEVTVREPVIGRVVHSNHGTKHYTGRDIQDTQLPPTEKIELPDTETMNWKMSSLELAQELVQQNAMWPRQEGVCLQLGHALAEAVIREHDAS